MIERLVIESKRRATLGRRHKSMLPNTLVNLLRNLSVHPFVFDK